MELSPPPPPGAAVSTSSFLSLPPAVSSSLHLLLLLSPSPPPVSTSSSSLWKTVSKDNTRPDLTDLRLVKGVFCPLCYTLYTQMTVSHLTQHICFF